MKEEKKEKINLIQKILKRKRLIIVLLLLITVGFFIRQKYFSGNGKGESEVVGKGTVSEDLILSGEINADEYAKLYFPTSGKISWVGVKEGDEVKKGQALTKLDTFILNSAFQQAAASLRAAEATVANVHDQVKDHSGDETFAQKDSRTTAEAAKDSAYEAYIAAEYNLRNSTLTAPFAGIVTYLAHPYSGINVMVTEIQAEIINPETIYFDVTADQTEVMDIYIGQKVKVVLDSLPDDEIKGEVSFISYAPKIGEAGTSYKVKIKFSESLTDSKKYRIGMGGDAKLILSEKGEVLYLPPEFVKADTEGKYVNKKGTNGKTRIEIGIESEDRVEIVSGEIKEGDVVYD